MHLTSAEQILLVFLSALIQPTAFQLRLLAHPPYLAISQASFSSPLTLSPSIISLAAALPDNDSHIYTSFHLWVLLPTRRLPRDVSEVPQAQHILTQTHPL